MKPALFKLLIAASLGCASLSAIATTPDPSQPPSMPPMANGSVPPPLLHTPAYPADLVPAQRNLAYAARSASQVLDLFLPNAEKYGKGPFPVVVNIHGGGFMGGSKEMLDATMARALLNDGVAVASLNYRVSGEAQFPAAVQDVKAAVRYLRANAARLQLDPDHFIAFGQSAGGNLASMLGVTAGIAEFDDAALGNAGVSSSVQAVIDWFGPSDFSRMDAQAKAQACPASSQLHGKANSPESAYIGCAVGSCSERAAAASPVHYVNAKAPPFLLQKGALDCTVPVAQSQVLYEALKASHVEASLDVLPATGHGDTGAHPVFLGKENIARVLAFVRRHTGRS